MKILLKAMYFHPEVGGMEVHVLNLARYFVRAGNSVEVVASNSMGVGGRETYDGIRIARTPFVGRNRVGWALTSILSVPLFVMRARDADLIHGHDIGSILPCVLAKAIYGKPFVLTLHSSHYIKVSRKRAFRPYLRWGIRNGDWVFAASEEIREITCSLVPGKEVEALVNPVDTRLFSPEVSPQIKGEDGEQILVCPRRLVEKNGVHILIEAMPGILATHRVKLVVAGEGPLRGLIEKRTAELGISEDVLLLGAVPNEKMPSILASADLIVIPSLMEATSIAALESMASGRAIAASDVGGLPEIIDGEVGFLMRAGDPADIAEKVNTALSDPADLKRKGAKARQRVVEKWSAEKLADYHIDIYRSLLDNEKSHV